MASLLNRDGQGCLGVWRMRAGGSGGCSLPEEVPRPAALWEISWEAAHGHPLFEYPGALWGRGTVINISNRSVWRNTFIYAIHIGKRHSCFIGQHLL